MNSLFRHALPLALLAALAGCVTPVPERALRVGASTEAEVVASQGRPTRIWPEADGGRTLEYATQPFGTRCTMVRIGSDGRVIEVHDALLPATRDKVVVGMTPEAVTRLLGRERRRVPFALSGEDVWDWNVASDSSVDLLRFNVHFKDGVVVRTSMSLESRNKPSPRS